MQFALNTACCERYQACLFKAVFGREPRIPSMTLLESSEDDDEVDQLDPTRLQAKLGKLVRAQEQLHEEAKERVTSNDARMGTSISKSNVQNFKVGDYVIVAQLRKSEGFLKLENTWIGGL